MMPNMRTTVTLEPDVAQALQEAARREGSTFKAVLNGAIRRGLSQQAPARPKPFRIVAHKAKLSPGLDPTGFNRLNDELENEVLIGHLSR
jgi:hypothetical protein